MSSTRIPFETFYREVFLPEHRHPLNVALHIGGTLAGLAWIPVALSAPGLWKLSVLLFPVVHAPRHPGSPTAGAQCGGGRCALATDGLLALALYRCEPPANDGAALSSQIAVFV